MSLLIFFSIVERLWPAIVQTLELRAATGAVSLPRLLVLVVVMVGVVAAVVAITIAARRIPIQIPRKVMGRGRIREGPEDLHPAPDQLRRRDADHLRAVDHHRAGHAGAVLPTSTLLQDVADYFQPGTWLYYVAVRAC